MKLENKQNKQIDLGSEYLIKLLHSLNYSSHFRYRSLENITMKLFLIAAALGLACASPVVLAPGEALDKNFIALNAVKRQDIVGDTANELLNGPCRPYIFIFARASTETGNIVSFIQHTMAS